MSITEIIFSILGIKLPVESYAYIVTQAQNTDTGENAGIPKMDTFEVSVLGQNLTPSELKKILESAQDKNKIEKVKLEHFNGDKSLSKIELEGLLIGYGEAYSKNEGITLNLTFSVKKIDAHQVKFTKERAK